MIVGPRFQSQMTDTYIAVAFLGSVAGNITQLQTVLDLLIPLRFTGNLIFYRIHQSPPLSPTLRIVVITEDNDITLATAASCHCERKL